MIDVINLGKVPIGNRPTLTFTFRDEAGTLLDPGQTPAAHITEHGGVKSVDSLTRKSAGVYTLKPYLTIAGTLSGSVIVPEGISGEVTQPFVLVVLADPNRP